MAAPAAAEVVLRPDLTLTDTNRHTAAVSVPVGGTLRVEMPAQPSTGYSWEPRPAEPAILEIGNDCDAGPGEGLVGGLGRSCYLWHATGEGKTVLSLVYRRHWETRADDTLLRFDIEVTVTPAR